MHRFAHKMTYAAAVLLLAGCGRSTSPGNMGPTGSTVSSSSPAAQRPARSPPQPEPR
jgi:hypothetical protein